MPTISKTSAGSVFVSGKRSRRLKLSATISGLVAQITVVVPEDVSQLEFYSPFGLGGLLDVTPGATEIYTYNRPPVGAREHPYVTVSFAVPGFKATPIKLRFTRDTIATPVPVTLRRAPTMETLGKVLDPVAISLPLWDGDASAREEAVWISSAMGGTYVSTGEVWTSVPDLVGTWAKFRARAYGPTAADPNVNDWTTYAETAPFQIASMAQARALTAADFEVDRSLYMPENQATYRTPILQRLNGAAALSIETLEYTAAALDNPSPTWNPLYPRSGETGFYDASVYETPAGPSSDPSLFSDAPGVNRAGRLRLRWRGHLLQPFSEPSTVLFVPAVITSTPFDFLVRNMIELRAAMAAAAAGQTIGMQPGTYVGSFSLNRDVAAPGVTIFPVNRANPPVIFNAHLDLEGSSGFTFDGIIFRTDIKDRSAIYGSGPYLYPADSSNGGVRAFTFHNTARMTLRNCVIDGFHLGLYGKGTSDWCIEYCHLTGIGMDSIRIYDRHQRPIIRHNLFDGPNVDHARVREVNPANGVEERHVDYIQASNNTSGLGITDGQFNYNKFVGSRGYHQCIFLMNERVARNNAATIDANGHQNCVVRGNDCASRHTHGITISGAKNILVEDNWLHAVDPGLPNLQYAAPPIDITLVSYFTEAGTSTGVVRNNVMPPNGSLGDNDLKRLTASGKLNSQAGLTRTGNRRSSTLKPVGWTDPKVGPYAYEN